MTTDCCFNISLNNTCIHPSEEVSFIGLMNNNCFELDTRGRSASHIVQTYEQRREDWALHQDVP
jgi:hypothetical protein